MGVQKDFTVGDHVGSDFVTQRVRMGNAMFKEDCRINGLPYPDLPGIVFEISNAILDRAIHDLKATKDYAVYNSRLKGIEINTPQQMIEVGKEVREWFNDLDNDEPFSFRYCCIATNRCYRGILAVNDMYLVPKNEYLGKIDNEKKILDVIKKHPNGISLYELNQELNRESKFQCTRTLVVKMYKKGLLEQVRLRNYTDSDGRLWKQRNLWIAKGEGK